MEQYFIFNSTIYGHGSLWVYPNETQALADFEQMANDTYYDNVQLIKGEVIKEA